MFLSKRGSTWYLYFRDSSSQRQKVSTHTRVKSEATKFLIAFKRDARESQNKVRHISLSNFNDPGYRSSSYLGGEPWEWSWRCEGG